jgi:hypothetical protein
MQDTGYGTAVFLRACRVTAVCREIEGSGPGARWRRFRAGSLELVWHRLRLPRVAVRPTASRSGEMIREHFAIRQDGHHRYRRAQGVLTLPAEFPQYLRGRHRQAVRTNVGRAKKAGLTVFSFALDSWMPGADDSRLPHIAPGPVERWLVLDAEGQIVADSIVSIDEQVALLHGLVSSTSDARWLLHTAIVERLCGCCEVLLTNSDDAYLMGPGNQHFQRLLGYRVSRLRIAHRARAPGVAQPSHPAALSWPPGELSWRTPESKFARLVKPALDAAQEEPPADLATAPNLLPAS